METAPVNISINGSPAAFTELANQLKALCRRKLNGYDEGTCYGMPAYLLNGIPEVAFHISTEYLKLYVLKYDLLQRMRPRLNGLLIGKGCLWFTEPGQVDLDLISAILDGISTPAKKMKKNLLA